MSCGRHRGDLVAVALNHAQPVAELEFAPILHDRDQVPAYDPSVEMFQDIAQRAGGAVLPFDVRSKGKPQEILEAVATLAVGGVKLLQERRKALLGAVLLLQHLPDKGGGTE